jgi:hypothetical protein
VLLARRVHSVVHDRRDRNDAWVPFSARRVRNLLCVPDNCGQFAGAWVPYGAETLPARSHSHARLLPAGPRLFLPGPSGPEGIVLQAYMAQVGMGAASALIPPAHRSHPWAPAVIIVRSHGDTGNANVSAATRGPGMSLAIQPSGASRSRMVDTFHGGSFRSCRGMWKDRPSTGVVRVNWHRLGAANEGDGGD